MIKLKNMMLGVIRHNAVGNIAELSDQYIHSAPDEKEAILAGIDFEGWLAEVCRECLEKPGK